MRAALCVVLLLVVMLVSVRADLPVHCEFPQIEGEWQFLFTDVNKTNQAPYTYCSIHQTTLPDVAGTYTLTLQGPNILLDTKTGKQMGTWTLVYDQGFNFVLDEAHGNVKAFAFFNYTMSGDKVISHCDRTFIGWFHRNDIHVTDNWGCFMGIKSSSNNIDSKHIYSLRDVKNTDKMVHQSPNKKFKNNEAYVSMLNQVQKQWKAKSYSHLETMTWNEVQRMKGTILPRFKSHSRKTHMKEMREKYGQQFTSNIALPESFDWRNVSGQNFVSPIRNQGSCGSCYAFASTAMYEARMRVASKNQKQPVYSPQDVVSCSAYSQGCEGGFAFLVSSYGQDYGLTVEQCDPYTAKDDACHNFCPATTERQFIRSFSYIGGYYGASTEELMMHDIMQNGPMAVSIEVYDDFMHYHGGIYEHVTQEQWNSYFESANASTAVNGFSPDPHFELTNHVVVIVGWGVDTSSNKKFWIVKNSWGTSWGVNGFVLIRKGVDEIAIESETITAALETH